MGAARGAGWLVNAPPPQTYDDEYDLGGGIVQEFQIEHQLSVPAPLVLYTEKLTGGCIQPPVSFVKNDSVDR